MREMKDSGIEWAPLIAESFSTKRIKYILFDRNEKNNPIITSDILSLTAKQGVVPLAEKEGGGNKPKEDLSLYRVARPGDIVMNWMNVISGSVAMSNYYGCLSPVYYTFRTIKPEDEERFFNYIFQTTQFQKSLIGFANGILIKESSSGKLNTIRLRISTETLGSLFVPYTSPEKQRKIANFLDAKCAEIDALTADIEKQIETLEAYKRSVITEAVTKGLNPNVKMKESKLEWVEGIPQNWEEKPYRVLFSEVTTKNKFGHEKNALKFTYGNIVPKTDFDADTDDYVADTILTYTIVEPGTIMINCLNLNYDFVSQRIGLVKDRGIITSAYLAIKPNSQIVCDRFANYQLKAFDGMKVFHNMGTGIRKTLGFDELGKKYFILPPLDEQMKIANYLDAKSEEIQAIINNKKEELSSLAEYKKSLIYEYVTGKKEVV